MLLDADQPAVVVREPVIRRAEKIMAELVVCESELPPQVPDLVGERVHPRIEGVEAMVRVIKPSKDLRKRLADEADIALRGWCCVVGGHRRGGLRVPAEERKRNRARLLGRGTNEP